MNSDETDCILRKPVLLCSEGNPVQCARSRIRGMSGRLPGLVPLHWIARQRSKYDSPPSPLHPQKVGSRGSSAVEWYRGSIERHNAGCGFWKEWLHGVSGQNPYMSGVRQAVHVDSRRTAVFPRETADQHPSAVQSMSFSQEGQAGTAGSRPDRGDMCRVRPLDHGSVRAQKRQPGLLLRMPGQGASGNQCRSDGGGEVRIGSGPHRVIEVPNNVSPVSS